jgi:hypothetical protein
VETKTAAFCFWLNMGLTHDVTSRRVVIHQNVMSTNLHGNPG